MHEALSSRQRIDVVVVERKRHGSEDRVEMVEHPRMLPVGQVQPALVVEHDFTSEGVDHAPDLVHAATVWPAAVTALRVFAAILRRNGGYSANVRYDPAVPEQRVAVGDVHRDDLADRDLVVAGREQLAQVAHDPGERGVEDRHAGLEPVRHVASFSRLGTFEANTRATSSLPVRRTLTAKRPASRTSGSVRADCSKQTSSSSGSSDTEQTALAVMPPPPAGPATVITATPVAKWPKTVR